MYDMQICRVNKDYTSIPSIFLSLSGTYYKLLHTTK